MSEPHSRSSKLGLFTCSYVGCVKMRVHVSQALSHATPAPRKPYTNAKRPLNTSGTVHTNRPATPPASEATETPTRQSTPTAYRVPPFERLIVRVFVTALAARVSPRGGIPFSPVAASAPRPRTLPSRRRRRCRSSSSSRSHNPKLGRDNLGRRGGSGSRARYPLQPGPFRACGWVSAPR